MKPPARYQIRKILSWFLYMWDDKQGAYQAIEFASSFDGIVAAYRIVAAEHRTEPMAAIVALQAAERTSR
ncbi:hypothetical protein [Mycolicibacterium fortuitum]|uniref:hypothetical protein n=1 Tax=Mycolicibacterium fortuitum TaxID=1766 RepID=UPI002624B971|nr:hypothetical protein [Mycolicibacterium fortuitum]